MLSLEYIAGLVDGEGSIGIINRMVSNRAYLDPYIHISNCNKEILEQVKESLGVGNVYKEGRQTTGHRDAYLYACSSRATIETALTKLLPYLVIKKQLAEIVLEFVSNRIPHTSYTQHELLLWLMQTTLQMKRNHSTKLH